MRRLRVELAEGLRDLSSVLAHAFREKGGAGFPVKAFPGEGFGAPAVV